MGRHVISMSLESMEHHHIKRQHGATNYTIIVRHFPFVYLSVNDQPNVPSGTILPR